MMLSPGNAAPDFEVEDQDGNPVKLSGLRGSPVVLYFYPKADTPRCTTQACGLPHRGAHYAATGAKVVGASPDTPGKLRKFADKYGLDFTLLADPDHAVAEQYGTWVEKSMYGKKYMGVARDTFVIDSDGKVARILRKVQPKTHDDVVLGALADLAAAAG